jgi:hypothetical protein
MVPTVVSKMAVYLLSCKVQIVAMHAPMLFAIVKIRPIKGMSMEKIVKKPLF